ncbi:hypothetical protein AU196_22690 [Mycobacterium sp. IS-1742]|uniref:hypothetical protein n=1 Tax=Mycobacterium sp. IS-1742 TaxID=1772285 RepID=UPI00073FD426|nr:hypothetical protein [Mycobacterium sp. IS-1742]KUI25613.1 hypothetical protein AU196_22690 [Mycobacterium sp. IS-1742]
MGARRQNDHGAGFAAVFVLLVVLGLIVEYFLWFAGAAALVGAFFAARAIVRGVEKRRLEAAERDAELARRAEQQHRWTLRGDRRGVFGPGGAEAMDAISPAPRLEDTGGAPPDLPAVAAVAYTKEDLAVLLRDKPPCWQWAAFASVLVQRRAPLQARLRDSALGFTSATGERLYTGTRVVHYFSGLLDELVVLVDQLESFMRAPAFTDVFGHDEQTADADGVVHTANRLMDYHDRLLDISERCRSVSVSGEYADVLRDCARVADIPLQAYRTFVDEFVERVGEMPQLLRYANGGIVEADPVVLHMDIDEQLTSRIARRMNAILAD